MEDWTTWLTALGLAVGAGLAVRLLLAILTRRLETVTSRTRNLLDDVLLGLLKKTRALFVLLVAVWVGYLYLPLPPEVEVWVGRLLVVGLLLQGALWSVGVVTFLVERYQERREEEDPGMATALGALGIVARALVWAVFLLLILDNLGVEVAPLIAGLGVGGIAVALAVQNVLGDLFASLSIVLDKPFVIGDFIVVGEHLGTVEHVGLKTTRLRSLSGEQLVFSNSDLLGSRIRNYKRMNERRVVFQIGVTYDTGDAKLERVPHIIREAVEAQEDTRFDRSHFKGFGASSLDFETVYFMLVPDYAVYMDRQQDINLRIYRAFQEEGIDFAFPTQTIHVQSFAGRAAGGGDTAKATGAGEDA